MILTLNFKDNNNKTDNKATNNYFLYKRNTLVNTLGLKSMRTHSFTLNLYSKFSKNLIFCIKKKYTCKYTWLKKYAYTALLFYLYSKFSKNLIFCIKRTHL